MKMGFSCQLSKEILVFFEKKNMTNLISEDVYNGNYEHIILSLE